MVVEVQKETQTQDERICLPKDKHFEFSQEIVVHGARIETQIDALGSCSSHLKLNATNMRHTSQQEIEAIVCHMFSDGGTVDLNGNL